MYHDLICDEFNKTVEIMKLFVNNVDCIGMVQSAARIVAGAFKIGRKVLACGNGGSHCNAMHFAEELTGRYRNNRVGYPAIAITDPSYLSCVSNDFGYQHVFSRYVESVGKTKDILFAISGSGQSINVLNALLVAHKKGMKTIFLTKDHVKNELVNQIDVNICVPYSIYSDYVQEVHMKIIHILVLIIEKEMLLEK